MDILTDVQEATKVDLFQLLNKLTTAQRALLILGDLTAYELSSAELGQIARTLKAEYSLTNREIDLGGWMVEGN